MVPIFLLRAGGQPGHRQQASGGDQTRLARDHEGAAEPARAAQKIVDGGFIERYDYAQQVLKEIPYAKWRAYDPEDTLRFYSLRLREVGMIKSTPNKIIAEGTDWRPWKELKRELKA